MKHDLSKARGEQMKPQAEPVFGNLIATELLKRANEALELPKNQTLPPEDECLRELAQRYVNLAHSIRLGSPVSP